MATEQIFEKEFDYQLLFKHPENPTPEPEEVNPIEKYLKQLAEKELPWGPYVRDYLQDQKRRNCRPSTMRGNFATLVVFLSYLKQERGRTTLETITRDDVSSFIEHGQDRAMQPNTVSTWLQLVYAFLHADEEGCDAFISLHVNADPNDQGTNGLLVCYRHDEYSDLTKTLRNALCDVTTLRRMPNQKRTDLAVLKFDGPAVLIELGFIGNDGDRETLLNPATCRPLCEKIAAVVTDYLT